MGIETAILAGTAGLFGAQQLTRRATQRAQATTQPAAQPQPQQQNQADQPTIDADEEQRRRRRLLSGLGGGVATSPLGITNGQATGRSRLLGL